MVPASASKNHELFLILAISALGLLGAALVALGKGDALTTEPFTIMGTLIITLLALHIFLRVFLPHSHPLLLPSLTLILELGIIMIASLKPELVRAQLLWIILGVITAVVGTLLFKNYHRLREYKYITALFGLALLLSPIFFGQERFGARLWLQIGSLSFQPAELSKILLTIFFAAYLYEKRELLSFAQRRFLGLSFPPIKYLGPILTMWLISLVLLIFERDLGSSFLFLSLFVTMIYGATGRSGYIMYGTLLFIAGASASYFLFGHVQVRIDTWVNPWNDLSGKGYQITQSLFAIVSGGISGTGLGKGHADLIPAVHTDFIFSAISEELGLAGALAVVTAYVLLLAGGLKTSLEARESFGKLLSLGLTTALGLQTLVILGGVTKLIPLTGITLPFMSYGGSSIVSNFFLISILASVSHSARTPEGADTALTERIMDSEIRKLGVFILAGFFILTSYLVYLPIGAASILDNPQNVRNFLADLKIPRGKIKTADGKLLAANKREGQYWLRSYPLEETAAHVTGYSSPKYGTAGLERNFGAELAGERYISSLNEYLTRVAENPPGNDLILTLESELQAVATEAMAGQNGALVALDPQSGGVLALVSVPSFDPNELAGLDSQKTTKSWENLSSDPRKPLLNRALQEWYPPGSAFKIVTAAATLENDLATPETRLKDPGELKLPLTDHTISNFGGATYGTITFAKAFRVSSNTIFAQLGLDLGAEKLVSQARAFGVGTKPPFELPMTVSQIPPPGELDAPSLAMSAIGQKDVRFTALEMALVSAAVANEGMVPKPYLVQEIRDHNGKLKKEFESQTWRRAMSPETALTLKNLMHQVVENGTGRRARLPGISVAGKTGTAQTTEKPHVWFVAFAPVEVPRIAVAVVVEEGGASGAAATGGTVAAPIAAQIIETAIVSKD